MKSSFGNFSEKMASMLLCRNILSNSPGVRQAIEHGIHTTAAADIYHRNSRSRKEHRGQPIEGRLTHPKATTVLSKKARFLNKLFALDATPKEKASKEKVLNPAPVLSKGGPTWLDMQSKGAHLGLSLKRQTVLNRSFTEAVSDVLQYQTLSDKLIELGVQITAVKVTPNCMYLHIYWTCTSTDNISAVGTELSQIRPEIRKRLAERNFTETLPHIYFIYDKQKMIQDQFKVQMREVLKEKAVHDSKDPSELTSPDDRWYRDVMEQDPSTVEKRPFLLEKDEAKEPTKGFLNYPPDMDHNALGVDFKATMSEVLAGMKKARSSQKFYNADIDKLPPVEYKAPIVTGPPHESPFMSDPLDPDARVRLMRNFIVQERKKRQRLVREARKIQALADLERDQKRDQAGSIVYGNTEEGSKYRLTEEQERALEEDNADRAAAAAASPAQRSSESESFLKIDFMYGRKQSLS